MGLRSIMGRVAAAGILASTPLVATPADASPPERIPFEEHYQETVEDWCGVPGLTVELDGVVSGATLIRDRQGLLFFTDHIRVVETHTGPNGVTTRYVERSMIKDLEVVDNGTTITVLVLGAGNAVLYGPDGRAIGRNPGQVRFRIVFDEVTGEELSFEIVKESTGRSDDLCAVEVAAFGF